MKQTLALAVAALLVTGVAANAQTAEMLRARGEALVTRDCAMCHAVGQRGSSPEPRAPTFRSLIRDMKTETLRKQLESGVLSSHPEMPHFKFSGNDVAAMMAYFDSLRTR